ncbi:MAG: hypothetical protein WA040_21095 [Anaerolineae bacterium]
MAAKYYTDADEGLLDDAQTAAETLLDFFYNRHGRFGIDNRTANRCASSLREVKDLLGQVQIVAEPVERVRRVQYARQ